MKVTALVVTYNRKELLKECIEALRKQTMQLSDIVVIDNGSTDGTEEWLSGQSDLRVYRQPNIGGAGGYSRGIAECAKSDVDYVWLMDDDTIPNADSLERLVDASLELDNVGFLCSRCVWNDGKVHKMNIPMIKTFVGDNPFNDVDDMGALRVLSCSFVSVMINMDVVNKIGLPYKEFFIWGDDMEYTMRIVAAGFDGYYIDKSVVLHKTASNYSTNIFEDSVKNLWKYSYGLRNDLFITRRYGGMLKYFAKLAYVILVQLPLVVVKRKESKMAFGKTLFVSSIKSLFFNPQIEKVSK